MFLPSYLLKFDVSWGHPTSLVCFSFFCSHAIFRFRWHVLLSFIHLGLSYTATFFSNISGRTETTKLLLVTSLIPFISWDETVMFKEVGHFFLATKAGIIRSTMYYRPRDRLSLRCWLTPADIFLALRTARHWARHCLIKHHWLQSEQLFYRVLQVPL
jgi:hypothetical protein